MQEELKNFIVDEALDQLTQQQRETNANAEKQRILKVAADFKVEKADKPIKFPLHAFPTPIAVAIKHWVDITNLSTEHFGTAVLSAASVVLGNKIKIKIREKWTEPPLLYCILLGSSGIGKTPIWNYAIQPVLDIEKELHDEYYEDMKLHKENLIEAANNGKSIDGVDEPKPHQIRVEKIATETLLESMWSNPHGIFLFRDELRAWFMSLNQGSGRDDVELFLEFWNNSSKRKDLKSGSYYIERTALNIIGGLQPDLMKQIATGTNVSNGLFQRFLCAYPYSQKVNEVLSEEQADKEICEHYNRTIKTLYDMEDYLDRPISKLDKPIFKPMLIPMTKDAYDEWHKYYGEISRKIKNTEDDNLVSTIRKHDKHVSRLALILRMLRYADEVMGQKSKEPEWIENNIKVEKEDIQNAVLLSRYFLYQSMRILDAVKTPAHALKPNYQLWYKCLPDSFQRSECINVRDTLKKSTEQFSISNGTIGNLLNDRNLFRKRSGSNGHYDKLWEI